MIDLIDACALFATCSRDLGHDARNAFDCLDQLAHRRARLIDQVRTSFDALDTVRNERSDLLRRTGAAHREVSNLARHDREPATLFTRARSFNGRVEG